MSKSGFRKWLEADFNRVAAATDGPVDSYKRGYTHLSEPEQLEIYDRFETDIWESLSGSAKASGTDELIFMWRTIISVLEPEAIAAVKKVILAYVARREADQIVHDFDSGE